ncbi:MAG: hypothetical protein ACI86M_000225 [Saprospiraceae bacterium]|jgi:hypothetical protein
MAKKILFTFLSIFLFYQSIKTADVIPLMDMNSWGISIFLAVLMNLFVTGTFAYAGFIYPTERILPNSYYKITNVSLQKKMYNFFNVNYFRKFLLATVWRKKEGQKKFFDGTKNGIDNFGVQSKKSEFGHLIPFVILFTLSVYWLGLGKWKVALVTTIINVFFNFYPIILQRQHRMRIQLIEEKEKKIKVNIAQRHRVRKANGY